MYYITLDTRLAEPNKAHDFEVNLDESINKKYRRVHLKSIYIQHETDISKVFAFSVPKAKDKGTNTSYGPVYIHCNLLTKDDNLINKEKSDVIRILYPDLKAQKNLYIKFPNNGKKILTGRNHIRLHLTDMNNVPVEHRINYYIIYELEFS